MCATKLVLGESLPNQANASGYSFLARSIYRTRLGRLPNRPVSQGANCRSRPSKRFTNPRSFERHVPSNGFGFSNNSSIRVITNSFKKIVSGVTIFRHTPYSPERYPSYSWFTMLVEGDSLYAAAMRRYRAKNASFILLPGSTESGNRK